MDIASIRHPYFSSSRRRTGIYSLLIGTLALTAPMFAQPSPPADALTGDPRLDMKVTLTRRDINLDDALQELSKLAQVKLATGGNELPHYKIILAVKDEPLRDVLRAVTVYTEARWKRMKTSDGQDALTLVDASDDPHYWDFTRPKTQAEADERRCVEDFQQKVARLSPDLRQALVNDVAAPNDPLNKRVGVPLTSLPAGMQEDARVALNAENQVLASQFPNIKTSFTEDMLSTSRASFKADSQGGQTTYTIHLRAAWVPEGDGSSYEPGANLKASVPDDPTARDETILPADFHLGQWLQDHHQAQAAARVAGRTKALKDDPRLNRLVSVKTDDSSAGYPLAALAEAAHVNIVSDMLPETHTVSLTGVPLKDALDQVAAKYRGAWTEAADGTIVVYRRPPTAQDFQAMAEEQAKRDAERMRAENAGK